jgi:receptor protein-tyrosine kinase
VPAAAHHHGQPDHFESDRDDAYRRARIGILAAAGDNAVIAVSAMSAREPGADVAVAVSRSLAAAGYRVALVDAAVDDARVAPLMGIDAGIGLSDALMAPDSDSVRSVTVDGVQVVTAGSDPHAARERYSGAAIGEVLTRLRAERDFVLLASSPITTGDGLAAVVGADSVVFVATDQATTHEQIAAARDLVKRLGVSSLGLLVLLSGKRRRRRRPAGHTDSIRPQSEAACESADASPDDGDSAMDESPAAEDEPNKPIRAESSPGGHNGRAGKRGGGRPAARPSGARGR